MRTKKPAVYLRFADRPYWFKAPYCDCAETTCVECFREGRTIGRLSDEERAERIAHMNARTGHTPAGGST